MRPIALLLVFLLAASSLPAATALAAPDAREMQARQAYAAGNYHEALDVYVQLYAEKLHPNFLRNIGRCYQNLGDPERAINSFREYLRKAKDVSPTERAEVNGYIAEMEELKKQRGRETVAAKSTEESPREKQPAALRGGAAPTAALAAPAPATPSSEPAGVNLRAEGGTPPSSSSGGTDTPLYQKWWFWGIIGGVVAAGVGVAAAAGLFTKTNEPACGPPQECAQ
jgi:tetratricopeptide (TPR) repeat protein